MFIDDIMYEIHFVIQVMEGLKYDNYKKTMYIEEKKKKVKEKKKYTGQINEIIIKKKFTIINIKNRN